jgi:hypothetical protein
VTGEEQLNLLARRLRQAGREGGGLRAECMKKITEAARPLVAKIADPEHLNAYLPDHYAAVLGADLSVAAQRIFAGNPRISIRCRTAGEHRRKVKLLDDGFINHPVYARGPRETWRWRNGQTGGMKAGFFTDVCKDSGPEVREKVMQAITETARKIAG